MEALICDICGGKLMLVGSGECAVCESCGVKHSKERINAKVQEIQGSVRIKGPVEVAKGENELVRLRKAADKLFDLGEIEQSEKMYQQITKDYPDDARSWWNLGVIAFLTHCTYCYKSCLKYFNYAIRLDSVYEIAFEKFRQKAIREIQDGKILIYFSAEKIEDFFGEYYDDIMRLSKQNIQSLNAILEKYPVEIVERVRRTLVPSTQQYVHYLTFIAYYGNTIYWRDIDRDYHIDRTTINSTNMNDIDKYALEQYKYYIRGKRILEGRCLKCGGKFSAWTGKCKKCGINESQNDFHLPIQEIITDLDYPQ